MRTKFKALSASERTKMVIAIIICITGTLIFIAEIAYVVWLLKGFWA